MALPQSFVGHLSFFEKILQMPHGGASSFVQISTVELREKCKYKSKQVKIYFNH